ncbi:D-2-hydroxyacid dehydrogenase [Paenibacillus flagellatus]|uniref:Glycerate dehydrogenase n=1 Tax=Paenibacillus flagellatus TaxID=2211139 RepID=A0A2V5KB39_9BACL|nr:D-2-hydroxyacid dehydrogenase [Paenibacillus flagellatus]PYI55133.1 glycerate dehydrogenase [Paenibacillus flagellatus]
MNIVVLDGFTLNPGDLSWDGLEALGSVVVYDRTSAGDIVGRASGAHVVLTNKTPITKETIEALPDLRFIGVLATGYNVVDIAAAAERGIPVANVPDYSTHSVAQLVFALLLELCQHVRLHSDAARSGEWAGSPDFCFTRAPLTELAGKTMGIIGFGAIGQQVARIAQAFGMDVIASATRPKTVAGLERVRMASNDEVFAAADVVSLHCPLTPATERLVNARTLALMKRTAFLINTSRGGLIAERDLAEALEAGTIAGAGVDVLSKEPPEADNPLLAAPNCLVTPHIAWATLEARRRLMDTAVGNVAAFVAGAPVNVVNR